MVDVVKRKHLFCSIGSGGRSREVSGGSIYVRVRRNYLSMTIPFLGLAYLDILTYFRARFLPST